MFNLDPITNKNNKDDDKKWPYRILIIRPFGLFGLLIIQQILTTKIF